MAGRSGVFEVDPISRIEGHLGVKLTCTAGVVTEADVHGNLWRGFENFLLNRDANDAITFTQRICGVCPVPHGQTSTFAVDAVLGYSRSHITFAFDGTYGIPAKAVLIRNLVLSAEFLMSHLTHFYHLVVLDYVQGPATPPWTPYFDDSFYSTVLLNPTAAGYTGTSNSAGALPHQTNGFSDGLWDAGVTQYVKALRIRRLTFEAGALFAGRMPMTSCFVGGGVTNNGEEDLSTRCATYKTIMQEVGEFIIKEHVPLVLALGALYPTYDNAQDGAGTGGYGAGTGNFVAWGAFPDATATGTLALPGGVQAGPLAARVWDFTAANKAEVYATFLGDDVDPQDQSMATNIRESILNSKYAISSFDTANIDATTQVGYPGAVQRTKPDRGAGYSYIKSPRWDGYACEVGPFARMVVAGFYPVDGGLLRTGFGAYYTAYAKTFTFTVGGAITGLDPAMVNSDLAVALVREGLATLTIDFNFDGTPWEAAVGGPSGLTTYVVDAATLAALEAVDPSITGAAYGLASAVITGTVAGFIYDLEGGLSVMDRIRARGLEALYLVQKMIGGYTKGAVGGAVGTWGSGWIEDLAALPDGAGTTWRDKAAPTAAASGYGATEAPRGALAHFATINASGKLTAYQCVVPTTWNASPKAGATVDTRGPMEQAMMGIPFDDAGASFTGIDGVTTVNTQAGIEALRVAHTFDPCIACAIH